VQPSSAALRLARRSRSLGRRTVVRSIICQDISFICQYVNVIGRRYTAASSSMAPNRMRPASRLDLNSTRQ
jgi:hypothetical protein